MNKHNNLGMSLFTIFSWFSCVTLLVFVGHIIGASRSIGCPLVKIKNLRWLTRYKRNYFWAQISDV